MRGAADVGYFARRANIEEYFDRTAADAWARLTSEAPVGRIRATVRAGRDEMRRTLLGLLPGDLTGRRVLDAGCGTGALALELARRGAEVVAVDLSRTLTDLARERAAGWALPGSVAFEAGDMLDPAWGPFDHVVAMDSLIHYASADLVQALSTLSMRASQSIVLTFAPHTAALGAMHALGRLFPRSERAPSIVPIRVERLREAVAADDALRAWRWASTRRVSSGFYTSQALELVRR